MYNLHKIILLYINEMFELKIKNSKPKDWSRIPLIIHESDVLLWIHDTRCEAKLISAKFLMQGYDLSVWDLISKFHDFPWLFQKILFFQVFQTLWEPWF